MATGTGKTDVAFQICWKLWFSKWNAKNDPTRKPRILYLADRNFLVNDPKDKTFAAFAMPGIKSKAGWWFTAASYISRRINPSQRTSAAPVSTRNLPPISSISSSWTSAIAAAPRKIPTGAKILEYFQPAYQLRMTATPLAVKIGTPPLFGNPVYTYSLSRD